MDTSVRKYGTLQHATYGRYRKGGTKIEKNVLKCAIPNRYNLRNRGVRYVHHFNMI